MDISTILLIVMILPRSGMRRIRSGLDRFDLFHYLSYLKELGGGLIAWCAYLQVE